MEPLIALPDQDFAAFQRFLFEATGISLGDNKKALVCGRLEKRLRHHGLDSYGDYLKLLRSEGGGEENQWAVDLLTTNETYFFREQRHFDLLRQLAQPANSAGRALRVWSAACSSGEEVYSIAMVLSEVAANQRWELIGSDISQRMLERARSGHYPLARASQIPPDYLQRYCLRGHGCEQGTLLVKPALRARASFAHINLDRPLPPMGQFDIIFLRNVMIYFQTATKQSVVRRLEAALRPGGTLLIGHAETLNDIDTGLDARAPSVYGKP